MLLLVFEREAPVAATVAQETPANFFRDRFFERIAETKRCELPPDFPRDALDGTQFSTVDVIIIG